MLGNFWCPSLPEAAFILDEVVKRRCYAQHGIAVADGDVVVDAGANIGADLCRLLHARKCQNSTVLYKKELMIIRRRRCAGLFSLWVIRGGAGGIPSKVWAVEPVPHNLDVLRLNLEEAAVLDKVSSLHQMLAGILGKWPSLKTLTPSLQYQKIISSSSNDLAAKKIIGDSVSLGWMLPLES